MSDDWKKALGRIKQAMGLSHQSKGVPAKPSSLPKSPPPRSTQPPAAPSKPVARPPSAGPPPPAVKVAPSRPQVNQPLVSSGTRPAVRASTVAAPKASATAAPSAPAPAAKPAQLIEGPRLATAVELPPERWTSAPSGARRINIGLDFGTSSTKVCVRPALGLGAGTQTYPIEFDSTAPNPFLCPSTIAWVGGRLYFGAVAESKARQGQVWRRIKVCVACEAERRLASNTCECSLRHHGQAGAAFTLPDLKTGPIDLTVLYLAWVLGEVHSRLPRALTAGAEAIVTCNLGVPVDQIEDRSPLRMTYERIAREAWRLRGSVEQGISASQALGWLTSLRSEPPDEDCPVELCPESSAAVVSQLSAASPMPQGMYALVDIGAWTTDISIFRLTDVAMSTEGVRTTAFYEAETHRIAAGRIDQLAASLVQSNATALKAVARIPAQSDDIQEVCRRLREANEASSSSDGTDSHPLVSALDFMRLVVAGEVKSSFEAGAEKAKLKESQLSLPDWKRLTVLLLGGGSEEACFEAALKKSTSAPVLRKLARDERLEMADSPAGAARSRRLQVAAGLAIPAALWPKRFLPSAVERLSTTKTSTRVRLDRDELYPK